MTQDTTFGRRMLFVVGSPRSGTTWVQKLLASHKAIVTGQETGLFDAYLGPMLRAYERDLDPEKTGRSPLGLGCYMTRDEFDGTVRQFLNSALEHIFADVGAGELFVEKTPSHALYIPEITALLPEARFVHVVRDGRDVVASLLAASRSWGAGWAPSRPVDAARMWLAHVRAARRGGLPLGASRFLEIRYEDLRADPQKVLGRVVAPFVGVDWSRDEVESALVQTSPEVQRAGKGRKLPLRGEAALRYGEVAREPQEFIRSAGKKTWRESLGPVDRLLVWRLMRRTLSDFGYFWPRPW